MSSWSQNKNCVTKYILRLSGPISRYKRMRIEEKTLEFKSEKVLLAETGPQSKKFKLNTRKSNFCISRDEISAFFLLFEESMVQEFLLIDICYRVSDNYLLAMVLAYFKRAHLTVEEFTKENFFIALYLANDMEEDEEDFKYEIFPWALGTNWRDLYPEMLSQKMEFWIRMNFRAAVSRKCCEEVMRIRPDHFIWKRRRNICHGGAIRNYHKSPEEKEPFPRGPGRSPIPCRFCVRANNSSGYLTDENISGDDCYLQVSRTDSSPDDYFNAKNNATNVKRRNDSCARNRAVVSDITNTLNNSKEKSRIEENDDVDSQSSFDMNKLRATLL